MGHFLDNVILHKSWFYYTLPLEALLAVLMKYAALLEVPHSKELWTASRKRIFLRS